MTPAKLTERHWWAILVDAEVVAARDSESALVAHLVSVRVRKELRDRFHVNLDVLWSEASVYFDRLMGQEKKKLETDKQRRQGEMDDVLERLLKKAQDGK